MLRESMKATKAIKRPRHKSHYQTNVKSQQVKLKRMDKMEEKNDRHMFLPKKKTPQTPEKDN